jgi:hypothetical protein
MMDNPAGDCGVKFVLFLLVAAEPRWELQIPYYFIDCARLLAREQLRYCFFVGGGKLYPSSGSL